MKNKLTVLMVSIALCAVVGFGQIQMDPCLKKCNDEHKACVENGLYTKDACKKKLDTCRNACSKDDVPVDPPENFADQIWTWLFGCKWG